MEHVPQTGSGGTSLQEIPRKNGSWLCRSVSHTHANSTQGKHLNTELNMDNKVKQNLIFTSNH